MSAATTTSNDTKASKDGLVGPDQILESEEYVTTKADGAVKIRFTEDEYGKMSADSVPGTLMKAAEEVPDIVALSVKRENKWVNWTYKEYLEGIYTLCILEIVKTEITYGIQIVTTNICMANPLLKTLSN